MIVTIRPRSLGTDMKIEARSLQDAAERFCRNIGLCLVTSQEGKTGDVDWLEFKIGTAASFTAFVMG